MLWIALFIIFSIFCFERCVEKCGGTTIRFNVRVSIRTIFCVSHCSLPHSDQMLRKLPTSHKRLSGPGLGYGLNDPEFESWQDQKIFPFLKTSRPLLGLTHPPVYCVPRFFARVRWFRCVADLSPYAVQRLKMNWTIVLSNSYMPFWYGQRQL